MQHIASSTLCNSTLSLLWYQSTNASSMYCFTWISFSFCCYIYYFVCFNNYNPLKVCFTSLTCIQIQIIHCLKGYYLSLDMYQSYPSYKALVCLLWKLVWVYITNYYYGISILCAYDNSALVSCVLFGQTENSDAAMSPNTIVLLYCSYMCFPIALGGFLSLLIFCCRVFIYIYIYAFQRFCNTFYKCSYTIFDKS